MPPNPAYHVVALSMPIVYTREGDHDPNGLLFTLKAHEPLLRWARDRWEDHDGFLPRLHQRRQRIQLVVDNLGLLNLIVPRLRAGSDADRELLAELVRREHVGGVPVPPPIPTRTTTRTGAVATGCPRTTAPCGRTCCGSSAISGSPSTSSLVRPKRRQACRSRTSGWSV